MTFRKMAAGAIMAGLCICSCEFRPFDHDLAEKQYEFAAVCLDAFFIFRDRLPTDLYAFSTPQELYESVDEPFTEFMDPEYARWWNSLLTTTHEGGIGIRIDSVANGYVIKEVFAKSPGEVAGLVALDTIIRVGDTIVAGMEWKSFGGLLRGELGSQVLLRIKRGGDLMNITVRRGTYTSPSVFVDSIDSATSMILLTGFYSETNMPGGSAAEFSKALDRTGRAASTIIDLRGNPGGRVDQSRAIIGDLVPEGTPIVRVHLRDIDDGGEVFEADSIYLATGGGKAAQRKLFVLVDSNTASAAEILVSCLKQREGVTVVGQRTYGKGRGQVMIWNPDDSSLAKITCMTLSPADSSAPSYDTIGIDPDVFSDTLDAFDVAIDLISGATAAAKRRASAFALRPGRREAPMRPRQPAAIIDSRGWHD